MPVQQQSPINVDRLGTLNNPQKAQTRGRPRAKGRALSATEKRATKKSCNNSKKKKSKTKSTPLQEKFKSQQIPKNKVKIVTSKSVHNSSKNQNSSSSAKNLSTKSNRKRKPASTFTSPVLKKPKLSQVITFLKFI
jgi:hypothetical protein